jgi:cytochrome c oxidase subunit 4
MEPVETSKSAVHPHPRFYLLIWGALLFLTIVEVGASLKLALPHAEMILLLVTLAIVKAMLVALYFMHLRFERLGLSLIVSLTLLLALILVVMNLGQWWFHSASVVMPPR